MRDRGRILVGLGIFLALFLVPLWSALARGGATGVPPVEVGSDAAACVRDAAWMRAFHMDLLEDWQDAVVRGEGEAFVELPDGSRRPKSLSRTCLACHVDKAGFCDRCHDAMGVAPDCWRCHTVPAEEGR